MAAFAALAMLAACSRARSTSTSQASDPLASSTPTPAPVALDACGNARPRPPRTTAPTANEQIDAGFQVFSRTCVTCHQPSGRGMPGAFPPLASSDFLMADEERAIRVVLGGLEGPVTVNDRPYQATMPSHACLSDDEVADVLTFVRNTWGNQAKPTTREKVAARRSAGTPTVRLASGR